MSPGALHLPGFDAVEQRFRASCEIRPGLPEAETHEEVVCTPAARDEGGGYIGGLFDREGGRIRAADLVRGRRVMNRGEPERERHRIAGTGLYLGWLLPIYGHALLESLARCWGPKDCDFAVYHAPRSRRVPAFLQAHLDRLGVPPVVTPTVPTRFEQLVVPWPALELKHRAYTGFLSTFPRAPATDSRPVYVSRSRLATDARAVAGEAVLERALSAVGYRIVHPETLSTPQQIDVFSRHTKYVGMIGSAMHNTLFNRSPEIVYLTDGEPNRTFLLCDALLGAESLYVGCCDQGDMPDLGRQMPLRLDLSRAGEALGVPVDAALQPAVDRRHREMWAEVRLKQGIVLRDRSALGEVRRHYGGPITPRLWSLANWLAFSTSRRGRSPRVVRRAGGRRGPSRAG